MQVDVAVIGGGPSGTSAALTLAKAGARVVIFERSRYDTVRIGETFPPEICIPLQSLGVWEEFEKAGHKESPGIVSIWGTDNPRENDFIFDHCGSGWHVDRRRFDQMLARHAAGRGAELFLSTTVTLCERTDRGWKIHARRQNQRLTVIADVVIDAFGRSGGPRGARFPRQTCDRLIACVQFFRRPKSARELDSRTIVEACPNGWWYSSTLPDEKVVVAFMTDADLVPRSTVALSTYYWQQLQLTTLTKRRLGEFSLFGGLRRFAAQSYERWGSMPNRLAVGDTALAFDPLSAQGVLRAMISGETAAKAVMYSLGGEASALNTYERLSRLSFVAYTRARQSYYAQENRWPQFPFWRRRKTASTDLKSSQ